MATLYPPAPNIGSQIERAVIAYLKSVFNDQKDNYTFYFSNDWKVREAPLFDVLAHKSTETVPHTRNESYQVRIEAKWLGTNVAGEPSNSEANPDTDWQAINRMIGVVMAAMSVGNPGAGPDDVAKTTAADITAAAWALAASDPTNNGDLAGVMDADGFPTGFVVEYVEFKGAQRAEAVEGTFYIKEVRNFEIRAGNY
jgi:hypothetical protein